MLVCSRWHRICLASPSLWSSISIPIRAQPKPSWYPHKASRLGHLRKILEYSQQHPLQLRINYPHLSMIPVTLEWPIHEPPLTMILPHAPRFSVLHLVFTVSQAIEFLTLPDSVFVGLSELGLYTAHRSLLRPSPPTRREPTVWRSLSLRRLTLGGAIVLPLNSLCLRWGQLLSLTLHEELSVCDVRFVLRSSPALRSLSAKGLAHGPVVADEVVSHSSLEAFSLGSVKNEYHFELLMNRVELPHLSALKVGLQSLRTLLPVVLRSRDLKTLVFRSTSTRLFPEENVYLDQLVNLPLVNVALGHGQLALHVDTIDLLTEATSFPNVERISIALSRDVPHTSPVSFIKKRGVMQRELSAHVSMRPICLFEIRCPDPGYTQSLKVLLFPFILSEPSWKMLDTNLGNCLHFWNSADTGIEDMAQYVQYDLGIRD